MRAGLWFGGDYNPEQWDEPVWAEDDALMRAARVNTATVGVFCWARLEPEEGRYDFGSGGRTWLFLLNHTTEPVAVCANGVELLSGSQIAGSVELPPGGVAVVREESVPSR